MAEGKWGRRSGEGRCRKYMSMRCVWNKRKVGRKGCGSFHNYMSEGEYVSIGGLEETRIRRNNRIAMDMDFMA